MSVIWHDNSTHRANLLAAEQTRQAAVTPTATRAAVLAADIAYYRTCYATAIANGVSGAQFEYALRELGTGGT
jgi:hypothetical protein